MESTSFRRLSRWLAGMAILPFLALGSALQAGQVTLSDAQIDDLVKRSFQYVAMYNVNNKFALSQGGWNTCVADTRLKDHTMRDIARPNNDTLYISCLLDLRYDPVILEMPAFDSKYVSLMITGYDHYVNMPMSTRQGDFKKPEKLMIYSARTVVYKGEAVEGIDRRFEATGDFVSAVFRVMPHASDKELFNRISKQMQAVRHTTLADYRGGKPRPINDIEFPAVGKTDADIFGRNLLEVMQFVLNHVTLDPQNELDQALLAAYEPLGVVPGRRFDAGGVAKIDAARIRAAAERIAAAELASASDPEKREQMGRMFLTKGNMSLDMLLMQSVLGPIGMPAAEALYPALATADGKPMNAQHDYVIRMSAQELPPAKAFWSVTLYDVQNGFFIPNDRNKYSVGENAGMKLNADGGIDIYITAQKPDGVPEENWLPINRQDEAVGPIMRIYVPDLEKMKTWKPPTAEMIAD
jgi:hypothetical protein